MAEVAEHQFGLDRPAAVVNGAVWPVALAATAAARRWSVSEVNSTTARIYSIQLVKPGMVLDYAHGSGEGTRMLT